MEAFWTVAPNSTQGCQADMLPGPVRQHGGTVFPVVYLTPFYETCCDICTLFVCILLLLKVVSESANLYLQCNQSSYQCVWCHLIDV